MIYLAIAVGCLIVVALALYISRTLKKARDKKQQQQENVEQHLLAHKERQEYVTTSINVIAKSLGAEQIDVVEASIRLKVLIDQLRPPIEAQPFVIMETIFEQTKDIPKLKDWQALEKKQRAKFSQKITGLELKHSVALKKEVAVLAAIMDRRA